MYSRITPLSRWLIERFCDCAERFIFKTWVELALKSPSQPRIRPGELERLPSSREGTQRKLICLWRSSTRPVFVARSSVVETRRGLTRQPPSLSGRLDRPSRGRQPEGMISR